MTSSRKYVKIGCMIQHIERACRYLIRLEWMITIGCNKNYVDLSSRNESTGW